MIPNLEAKQPQELAKLHEFGNRLLLTPPQNRSILVIKPHAFEDEHFTMTSLDLIDSLGITWKPSVRMFQTRDEVTLLHTVLELNDPKYGNKWKNPVYEESLRAPFLGIGLIGEGIRDWAFHYKWYVRNELCPGEGDQREIVRNYLHTPDDIGDPFPHEFYNTVNLFFLHRE